MYNNNKSNDFVDENMNENIIRMCFLFYITKKMIQLMIVNDVVL